MYEGVLPPSASVPKLKIAEAAPPRRSLLEPVKRRVRYRFSDLRHDNHYAGAFWPLWFKRLKRPARIRWTALRLRSRFTSPAALPQEFAFYPLHKEPEVTLLVYGRPYRNQIEVVRNLAAALPVGMKLVVKEHPGAIGYRPLEYYLALLQIPNVVLVPPQTPSRQLVEAARLVAVVAGSVGLEALMLGRPVITLGHVPYACMPDTMVRHVAEPDRLAEEVRDLLERFQFEEDAVLSYIAAVANTSVAVDFYSVLLGRQGVYRPDADSGAYASQVATLAEFIVGEIEDRRDGQAPQRADHLELAEGVRRIHGTKA